jgi:3D (Asp-Asp-Asp) domain-containing protein
MKDYDIMSYQELKVESGRLNAELALIKLNDIKTERMRVKEQNLKYKYQKVLTYISLAKEDRKTCIALSDALIKQILEVHGVYTQKLAEDISSRVMARHVDVYFTSGKKTNPKLREVKNLFDFRFWLRHKLHNLVNLI